MKKVKYLFFILCFGHLFAQNTQPLFSFLDSVSLNTEQQFRYEGFSELEYVDSVKIITVLPIASIQNNGKIAVSIPNSSCGNVFYTPKHTDYIEEGEYIWSGAIKGGEIEEECDCGGGEFVGMSKGGHKYGAFSIGSQFYEYWDLTGGKQILLYLKSSESDSADCPQVGIGGTNYEPVAKTSSCMVKVLVLYNDFAQNTWIDIPDKAHLAVAQCNSAYRNSDISDCDLEMVLVGVEYLDFDQTNIAETDVRNLCGNSVAQNLRAQYNADMVVLLGCNYPDAHGIAASLNVVPDSAYAIVNIHSATRPGRWTFAHETGHLFGGFHDAGPHINTTTAKGFRFIDGEFCQKITLMAILQTPVDNRVLHYSNPEVKWHDVETGTSTHNVAEQLKNVGCMVGNFMEDSPTIDVLLIGDSKVCPCKHAYFSAQISGGVQPYSGYWQYSTDGINWLPSNPSVGSCGANLNYSVQLGCNHLDYKFVRLTVFSANGASTAKTRYVEVDENLNCPIRVGLFDKGIKAYPNPSSENIVLEIMTEQVTEMKYEIYGILGNKITEGKQLLQKGLNELTLNKSILGKGTFTAVAYIGQMQYTQLIIVE